MSVLTAEMVENVKITIIWRNMFINYHTYERWFPLIPNYPRTQLKKTATSFFDEMYGNTVQQQLVYWTTQRRKWSVANIQYVQLGLGSIRTT